MFPLSTGNPTLALGADGTVYAAWSGFGPSVPGGNLLFVRAFLARSTDGGATFGTPVAMSPTNHSPSLVSVAVAPNGNVLATYFAAAAGRTRVWAVRSTDRGATFTAPVAISEESEAVAGPAFAAFDSRGAAYVAYNAQALTTPAPPPTVKLAIARDGQAFATPTLVSNSQLAALSPHLAVDRDDNLYVGFYHLVTVTGQPTNREVILTRSTDGGATFGPLVNVSNNTGQSLIPFVIPDRQGRVSVVWEDTTGNAQRDVLLAQSSDGGQTFGPAADLSGNPGISFNASGAIDREGTLYVSWMDDSAANTELLIAVTPDYRIGFRQSSLAVTRGQTGQLPVEIIRTSNLVGNVTVTRPDASAIKVKLKPATVASSGSTATFNFRIKPGATVGTHMLTFTASDERGRQRQATLRPVIE